MAFPQQRAFWANRGRKGGKAASKYGAAKCYACVKCGGWAARKDSDDSVEECCEAREIVCFDSKRERDHWQDLRMMAKNGLVSELVVHPKFPIVVNGHKIATYVGDFQYVNTRTGEIVVEDVKGYLISASFKLKAKLVKALHGVDVQIVK